MLAVINLTYFPISEENPFWLARDPLNLDHPEIIFGAKIRAHVAASIGLDNLNIYAALWYHLKLDEVKEGKNDSSPKALFEVSKRPADQGEVCSRPKIGVMLEVPAVIFSLPQLPSMVDFFSWGQ